MYVNRYWANALCVSTLDVHLHRYTHVVCYIIDPAKTFQQEKKIKIQKAFVHPRFFLFREIAIFEEYCQTKWKKFGKFRNLLCLSSQISVLLHEASIESTERNNFFYKFPRTSVISAFIFDTTIIIQTIDSFCKEEKNEYIILNI